MTVTRTREPELEAEQEVDLGRYARTVAVRWWLPVAGLIAGALLGYLISFGGSQVWRASATVYLGTPYSGSSQLQSQQTNPTTVNAIVKSEEAIDAAAAAAGLKPAQLRGNVTTQPVAGSAGTIGGTRTPQNPLVRVTVEAPARRKARLAANSFARQVVEKLSGYALQKSVLLRQRIASDRQQIATIRRSSAGNDAALVILLGQILQDQIGAQQQLLQVQQIEMPSVLTHAVAVRATARSRRNDVVVGAFLGLVIDLIAALAWEPVVGRRAG
jgi:hypothetical protein